MQQNWARNGKCSTKIALMPIALMWNCWESNVAICCDAGVWRDGYMAKSFVGAKVLTVGAWWWPVPFVAATTHSGHREHASGSAVPRRRYALRSIVGGCPKNVNDRYHLQQSRQKMRVGLVILVRLMEIDPQHWLAIVALKGTEFQTSNRELVGLFYHWSRVH